MTNSFQKTPGEGKIKKVIWGGGFALVCSTVYTGGGANPPLLMSSAEHDVFLVTLVRCLPYTRVTLKKGGESCM